MFFLKDVKRLMVTLMIKVVSQIEHGVIKITLLHKME